MSSTQEWRKCYICGEPVLWQTNGIGWHPIQYHDCKPVPGAWLAQARRERDEARVMVQHNLEAAQRAEIERDEANAECREKQAIIERFMESERQAVALLREARNEKGPHPNLPAAHVLPVGLLNRIRAFLAGKPAPVKLTVDDAMVERAQTAYTDAIVKSLSCDTDTSDIHPMHAALVAALEGGK